MLSGSGIAAHLPGCAASRAASTVRAWPAERVAQDAQARLRLKALWLAAKLREAQAQSQEHCESTAVLHLLARDMHRLQQLFPAAGTQTSKTPSRLTAGHGSSGAAVPFDNAGATHHYESMLVGA